jgi:hypothetical protein
MSERGEAFLGIVRRHPAKARAGRQYGTAVDGKKTAQCGFREAEREQPAEIGL